MILKFATDCTGLDAPYIALQQLNIKFKYIFASEIDSHLYNYIYDNHKPNLLFNDITIRDHSKLPKIDLYICGFPCPSFSSNGKYKEGFNSIRGSIFFHCIETIKYTKPKFFSLENVKNLITHDKGNTFTIIQNSLKQLHNYNIYFELINAKYFLPQDRTRIYIIGIHKKYYKSNFNGFNHYNKIETNISTIIDYTNKSNIILPYKKKLLLDSIINKYNIHKHESWIINLNTSNINYASTRFNLSPTLLTSSQMYYITNIKRFLHINELLKLQGLESINISSFNKTELIKAIGNSMCVPVIKFLFHTLI